MCGKTLNLLAECLANYSLDNKPTWPKSSVRSGRDFGIATFPYRKTANTRGRLKAAVRLDQ